MPEFEYKEKNSEIFKKVNRPLIQIEIFSENRKIWIPMEDTLVDTGADLSLLPRVIGDLLLDDITIGRQIEIRGVVPYSKLICYLHKFRVRIGNKEFNCLIGIADSDNVPPILGRIDGLDLFNVEFLKGKKLKITE